MSAWWTCHCYDELAPRQFIHSRTRLGPVAAAKNSDSDSILIRFCTRDAFLDDRFESIVLTVRLFVCSQCMASVLRQDASVGDERLTSPRQTLDALHRMTAEASRRHRNTKRDICERYINFLRERTIVDVDAPDFVQSLEQHFFTLPTRYALDVNLRGTEVLKHKELLERARQYPDACAFVVRDVQVFYPRLVENAYLDNNASFPHMDVIPSTPDVCRRMYVFGNDV